MNMVLKKCICWLGFLKVVQFGVWSEFRDREEGYERKLDWKKNEMWNKKGRLICPTHEGRCG